MKNEKTARQKKPGTTCRKGNREKQISPPMKAPARYGSGAGGLPFDNGLEDGGSASKGYKPGGF
jgi:hypothetical protein